MIVSFKPTYTAFLFVNIAVLLLFPVIIHLLRQIMKNNHWVIQLTVFITVRSNDTVAWPIKLLKKIGNLVAIRHIEEHLEISVS